MATGLNLQHLGVVKKLTSVTWTDSCCTDLQASYRAGAWQYHLIKFLNRWGLQDTSAWAVSMGKGFNKQVLLSPERLSIGCSIQMDRAPHTMPKVGPKEPVQASAILVWNSNVCSHLVWCANHTCPCKYQSYWDTWIHILWQCIWPLDWLGVETWLIKQHRNCL